MRALIVLVMLAALLLGACDDSGRLRYFSVRNTTSQELYVARADDKGDVSILGPSVLPGAERVFPLPASDDSLFKGDCTIRDLLAVDTHFREVARRTPPLCDHQLWVIGGPSPSGS